MDTCISPFPPYSSRFSRPFVFDLGIHEKPFHFFLSQCVHCFFETLHPWFLFSQYLVAYDASLLGSECYYNHFSQRNVPLTELVGFFFIIIKEYFPTAASATITLLRLHFDQVDQLRSFHKHSFLRESEEFITCLLLGSSENPLS